MWTVLGASLSSCSTVWKRRKSIVLFSNGWRVDISPIPDELQSSIFSPLDGDGGKSVALKGRKQFLCLASFLFWFTTTSTTWAAATASATITRSDYSTSFSVKPKIWSTNNTNNNKKLWKENNLKSIQVTHTHTDYTRASRTEWKFTSETKTLNGIF